MVNHILGQHTEDHTPVSTSHTKVMGAMSANTSTNAAVDSAIVFVFSV